MERYDAPKRPWVAALLGAAGAGAGHLYLRRWGRALAWVGVWALVSTLLVPASVFESVVSPGGVAWLDLLPLAIVSVFSALDAYRLAVVDNYLRWLRSHDAATACPDCGRPIEGDLDFCQWCATRVEEPR